MASRDWRGNCKTMAWPLCQCFAEDRPFVVLQLQFKVFQHVSWQHATKCVTCLYTGILYFVWKVKKSDFFKFEKQSQIVIYHESNANTISSSFQQFIQNLCTFQTLKTPYLNSCIISGTCKHDSSGSKKYFFLPFTYMLRDICNLVGN